MKITLLLLILGLCLVSAKYLPYESENANGVLLREKRSDSEESDSSFEHDSNDESEDDDSIERKLREREEKRREKEEKEKRKALERAEKEKRREEEHLRKIEEKREKEERKHQEKLEKERRKQEERQRKLEEKRLKEEKKRQEKEIKELRKEAMQTQLQDDSFLDTEEENSVELEDIWRQHIYTKYGLNFASTRLEKQAALNKYIQEELGLQPNSTKSERRRAILNLIQTKLQNDAAEKEAIRKQILSHVNAVTLHKLRNDLENDIEEINNKTDLLKNVQLPWAVPVQQNLEEKRTFLQGLSQFLSNILPNWISSNQPPTPTSVDSQTNENDTQNINSNNDVSESSGNGELSSGSSISVPNGENDSSNGNENNELPNSNSQAISGNNVSIIGNDDLPNNSGVNEGTIGNVQPSPEITYLDLDSAAKPGSDGASSSVSQGNIQDSSLIGDGQLEQGYVTSNIVTSSPINNEPLQNEGNSNIGAIDINGDSIVNNQPSSDVAANDKDIITIAEANTENILEVSTESQGSANLPSSDSGQSISNNGFNLITNGPIITTGEQPEASILQGNPEIQYPAVSVNLASGGIESNKAVENENINSLDLNEINKPSTDGNTLGQPEVENNGVTNILENNTNDGIGESSVGTGSTDITSFTNDQTTDVITNSDQSTNAPNTLIQSGVSTDELSTGESTLGQPEVGNNGVTNILQNNTNDEIGESSLGTSSSGINAGDASEFSGNTVNPITENNISDSNTETSPESTTNLEIPTGNNLDSIQGEFNNVVDTSEGITSSNVDIISVTESISKNEGVVTPDVAQSQGNSLLINSDAVDTTPAAETFENSASDSNKDASSFVLQESLATTTSDVMEAVTEANNVTADSNKPTKNEEVNPVQSNVNIDLESTMSVVPDVNQAATGEINEVTNQNTITVESQTLASDVVTEVLPSTDVIQSEQSELIAEQNNAEVPQTETTQYVPSIPINNVEENYTVDAEPGATIVDVVAQ